MRLFSSGTTSDNRAAGTAVTAEIDQALQQHVHDKHQPPHGLIIGLEKYRRLREQARKTDFSGRYNGMPIIVDSTERHRIAVF